MNEPEEKVKEKTPFITYLLLSILVVVQLYLLLTGVERSKTMYATFSLVPVRLFQAVNLDSLVTYMFLHGNLVHLIVNGFALYGAGVIVEKDIGHLRYLLVFIVSGVVSGAIHCYLNPASEISLVGSSGAIFGLIAVLFLLMPFKLTFALVVPMPSVVVGLMLSLVELSAFWMASDVGIAHDVHLSGFVMGTISAFIIDRKRALKGLIIATIILALIYYVGIRFNLLP